MIVRKRSLGTFLSALLLVLSPNGYLRTLTIFIFFRQLFKKRAFLRRVFSLFFISCCYFNFGNKKVPKSKRIAIETKIENKLIFNSAQGSNKKMMPKNKTSTRTSTRTSSFRGRRNFHTVESSEFNPQWMFHWSDSQKRRKQQCCQCGL